MRSDEIVLVNEHDEEMGTMEKMETHRKGLLHRAFSVFIYNKAGDMLLQQRALSKYHSGGLWTNACCSHPYPGETPLAAGLRRLHEELGFSTPIQPVFEFVYKASFDNGLTEHEYDHVFVGEYNGPITPNKAEVHDYCYMSAREIETALQTHPRRFTAWFQIAYPRLQEWRKQSEVCIG